MYSTLQYRTELVYIISSSMLLLLYIQESSNFWVFALQKMHRLRKILHSFSPQI